MLSRYPGLYRKLQVSPSKEVRMLLNMVCKDPRSTTCMNIKFIREKTGMEDAEYYSSFRVKEALPVPEVPSYEIWMIGLLVKLMEMKQKKFMEVKDSQQLTSMIDSLCST